MEWVGFSIVERSQPKGVKPKMRGRKLRCVYWKGALKQKGLKQVGRETRAGCNQLKYSRPDFRNL
jgi:hypothetical protein